MLRLEDATLSFEDSVYSIAIPDDMLANHNGHFRVLLVGDTATISLYERGRRDARVDQFIHAKIAKPTKGRTTYTLTGVSTKVMNELRVPADQASVEIEIEGINGCPSCL